jgi:hypothetical protein
MLWPQLVQKAVLAATSALQDGHWRVKGWDWAVAVMPWAFNEEPQFMQNDAPGRLALLQRGQVIWASTFDVGALGCTGVPHSGQNFLPVTSFPQDVHVAIDSHLPSQALTGFIRSLCSRIYLAS